MQVRHRNKRPKVHQTAVVSPGAILSGDVTVGAHCRILAGAVVTSEGAPVVINECCVIMENAVIRGSGPFPCWIGDHVLIGPHAHISGAHIEAGCFVATGATILNGALLGEGTVVAIHAAVHIAARCPAGTVIPIGHIAIGDPIRIYSPEKSWDAMEALAKVGFTSVVFGFDSSTMNNGDATREVCDRYVRALLSHREDRVLDADQLGA